LAGNSDLAVPTEKAVKTYVDGAIAGGNLVDLLDVDFDTGTPADNNVLTYDNASGKWKAEAPSGGASQLSELSDVGVTTPTNKNVLIADGDSWESRALVEADISDLGTYLENLSEDTTPQLGGDLDLNGKNINFPSVADISDVKDEDDMASNSDKMLATQQSIKAYVDNNVPDLSTSVDDFTIKYEDSKLKIADRIEQNIMLNFFKDAVRDSLSIYNLVDGFIDEYEDESGIDTEESINEDYSTGSDYYQPTSIENLELDYIEYSSDELARASWISSDPEITGEGIDANTVLMLHCNGEDEGVIFTDSSPAEHGNATVVATVQTKTNVKKWGSASGLFDGDSGYIYYADNVDWDIAGSASQDYTIDLWVKFNTTGGSVHETFIAQCENDNNENNWIFYRNDTERLLRFTVRTNNSNIISFDSANDILTDTDWHHVALCKVWDDPNTLWGIYLDGTQVAYASNTATATFDGILGIGAMVDSTPGRWLDGYMDELRIHKSNIFNATPNDTPNDTIDIPIEEYAEPVDGSLNIYSEDTIKTQGSYSLKAIADVGDSLNETITKTLGTENHLDLTNYNTIKLDVYASEVGTNLQIQIHDSGGTTSTKNITIETGEEDSWKTITWDISGISSANKDDIDSIIIKIISSDTGSNDNTFYIDNMYAVGLTQNMTLISNSQTAEASPSQSRIIIFQENVDAISLNVDLKAYVTRENGTGATWEQVTLEDEGNYEGTKRVLSGIVNLDVTGMGSGTHMAYKIITHNNKDLKIHGTGVFWN